MRVKAKIIGTGGIALCLIDPLCRLLNYGSSAYSFDEVDVALIDGDEFEERNKPRQKFGDRGNKAEVTKQRLEEEFFDINFRAHPAYVDEGNIGMFIGDGDVVFLCVDNHKTRKLVSIYCQEELDNITLINGGNNSHDGNVMLYLKRDGVDLTLPLHTAKDQDGKVYHPEILNPPEGDLHPNEEPEDREGCLEQQADDPQLLVANNMAAAWMLATFHGVLNGSVPEKKDDDGNVISEAASVFVDPKYAPFFKYDETQFDIRNGAAVPQRRTK